jgi:hypothetical protein
VPDGRLGGLAKGVREVTITRVRPTSTDAPYFGCKLLAVTSDLTTTLIHFVKAPRP